jgi:hypothetical protein
MMSMRVNKYQQPDKDGAPTTAPEAVGRKNERQQHTQSCVVKSTKQKKKEGKLANRTRDHHRPLLLLLLIPPNPRGLEDHSGVGPTGRARPASGRAPNSAWPAGPPAM